MNYTGMAITFALLVACAVPSSAAQKKKDALTERWANNGRLSKLYNSSEDITYYYNDSLNKVVLGDSEPARLTMSDGSDGIVLFTNESGKKPSLPENIYSFWIAKLDKPYVRGKRTGVLKDAVSATSKWQVDCDKSTYSILTSTIYDAKGEQIKTIDNHTSMKEPVPDSGAELIMHYMCARIKSGVITLQSVK